MTLKQENQRLPTVEFRLLGGFDVRIQGEPMPPLRSRRELWLLTLLVLRHDRETSRDWLATTLWPDNEERQALFYLRKSLSNLRTALGPEAARLLSPTPRTIRLNLADAFSDVAAFDAAIEKVQSSECRMQNAEVRMQRKNSANSALSTQYSELREAVSLYRGPLLPDCQEEWAVVEREAREQAYLNALETLSAHATADGESTAAVHYLRLLLATDPYRESACCALMQALADCGDQAAMTQVYRDMRRLLHRDLNTEPAPGTVALYNSLRQRETQKVIPRLPLPSAASSAPLRRLPVPLSDLIGREKEKEEIAGWLNKRRLVTLIGTGGVGKTRLAIAVSEQVIVQFPEGAYFVDLAPLSDPALVSHALLRALDLKEEAHCTPEETLEQALASLTLLLVMDNCEHLLEACASLTHRLLSVAPGLRVLATSREALGIPGEHLCRISSLSLPPEETSVEKSASALLEYAAVRLFVERAKQANSSFQLNRNNTLLVVQICSRLDGIPLAIEMAAARLKALSIGQLAARLEKSFALLTAGNLAGLPRQRTLQAAIDWSHDLLSEEERILFRRLSVFSGGWTLESAEAVCGGTGVRAESVLDLLIYLVEKSLVVFEDNLAGEGRYRFLETIRQYGVERLTEAGEPAALCHRHRDYFLQWVETVHLYLSGETQGYWLSVMEREHDNLRSALMYCIEDPESGEQGLRFGVVLSLFWHIRGHLSEGRERLKALLAHPGAQERTSARADILFAAGQGAWFQGDYASAHSLYQEALAIRRQLGGGQGIAKELGSLACIAYYQGDYASARSLYEEALAIQRKIEDRQGIAHSLTCLGDICEVQGERTLARSLYEESLAMERKLGHRAGIAQTLGNLGIVICKAGDHALANSLYEESLAMHRELGHRAGIAGVLKNIGELACSLGEYASARSLYNESLGILWELGDRYNIANLIELMATLALREARCECAVHLWGVASVLRESLGSPLSANERENQMSECIEAQTVLGAAAYNTYWEKGRAMTLAQAVEYANTE